MLESMIRFALRFRGVIYALAVLAAIQGIDSVLRARLDVFPEFAPPMTMIQAEAPGLSSEQVEALVTRPIENALAGTSGLQALRSRSLQGLSVVTVLFDEGTDILRARELVAQRLGAIAAALPAGVAPPAMLPLTTSTSTVLMIGLTSASRSLMDLHDSAEWVLRPQLLAVPGVAEAVVFGGDTRQLQVQVDPAKLVRYDLTLQDVLAAARAATGVRGAGFIESANQRITLHPDGQVATPEALAQTVLRWRDGAGIRLGDVATVAWGPAPASGAASVMGKPGVIMVLQALYGGNTMAVTRGLEQALASLRPELARQGIQLHGDIFRPANFIDQATHHLGLVLLVGGALVIVILFLFLMDARTALISAVAIPLSLLAAVIVLGLFGVSMNTMTLGGLAIALGEVVDDAIIDVENIHRRLRENRLRERPLPALQVVLAASVEVRSAVVYATFIVILVFLPVLALPGVAGKLFAPLGSAYILAVAASLIVALTVTPAMSLALLAREERSSDVPRWVRRMKARYLALLGGAERRSTAVMIAVGICCAAGLAMLPFFSGSFIPELREGHYIAHLGLAPGTSLRETMRVGQQISGALLKVPGVRLVAQTAGRAGEVVDPANVRLSEMEIDLQPMDAAGQERSLREVRNALARFPGLTSSVNTFLVERIDETISGSTAPVVLSLYGQSLDELDRKAAEVAQWLGTLRGAAGVRVGAPAGSPEWSIRLRPEQLSRYGLRPAEALDAIQAAMQGVAAAQVYRGSQVIDLTVMLAPSARQTIDGVRALLVRNPDGRVIPLRALADIRQVAGREEISHRQGQRVQTVEVTLGSRAAADFVREARSRIGRDIVLPKGMFAVFAGESEARSESQRALAVHGLMALAGIMLLLFLALKSRRAMVLVMANLPFALVGGVLGVALTGGALSLGAMVGFVTLFGISLRNAIMLVSHYEHLVHVEQQPWNLDTALHGASERLVPILMTALVTALALLPLALTSGAPGNEIEGPMAVVILGGLVTSTILNLIVLPVLAVRYGRFDMKLAGEG
ncbi:efflux RND transporter permease subunit [Massilia terrae]|uniref:Efflux RND transporter permease subunit n=1 Tax=Massilia terrae TaxID=1811224 RepID=A0ABT2CZC1_9BURK|nr:efflux RND transporter permease subunit [Massilia terrae]MCS0659319.1 efflux RND transporter permease subunit [Massilia terrae]